MLKFGGQVVSSAKDLNKLMFLFSNITLFNIDVPIFIYIYVTTSHAHRKQKSDMFFPLL